MFSARPKPAAAPARAPAAAAHGAPSSASSSAAARPLHLLMFDEATQKFELGEEALACLREIRGPVGVLAVCGRARQGKSFILNQLAGRDGAPLPASPLLRSPPLIPSLPLPSPVSSSPLLPQLSSPPLPSSSPLLSPTSPPLSSPPLPSPPPLSSSCPEAHY